MRPTHRSARRRTAAGLVLLPAALVGCGIGGDDEDEPAASPSGHPPRRPPPRSRERVQAYLDAMAAKDVAAGRSQLCALLHDGFDARRHRPERRLRRPLQGAPATITDVRSGPRGQEVSASVAVTAGKTQGHPPAAVHGHPGRRATGASPGEAPGRAPAASPTPTRVAASPAS